VTRQARAGASILAALFLVLHLPFLPPSLEDHDSINFALGVRQFDVARHQPHPPGYPIFIALAKGVHLAVSSEAHSLSLVGIFAAASSVFALVVFYRRVAPAGVPEPLPVCAAVVTGTAPLYWFTAGRPLSDATGLAAAVAAQALLVCATTPAALAAASFAAGVATGVRSQAFWLTAPLVLLAAARWARVSGPRTWLRPVAAFLGGVLAWAIPLVLFSGGPHAYWRALSNQGAEDLGGVVMLWTTPTFRELRFALYNALVAPWAVPWIAAAVLVAAIVGLVRMLRTARSALVTLAVAFGPYFVFDLLFQETVTTRYAMPLVVPIAYLASRGVAVAGTPVLLALVIPLSIYDAHLGGTSLAAYAARPAPAFRLLADLKSAVVQDSFGPVLAMDRREALDLRRPAQWIEEQMPRFETRLPSPPQREWLEVVDYLAAGGSRTVWFLADPRRADIHLIDHDDPVSYRWALPYPDLIGGVRPSDVDWYRIDGPDWFVGEGWALTPEAGGIAEADRSGPSLKPIVGWISKLTAGRPLMIGGRNLSSDGPPVRLTAKIGDGADPLLDTDVGPGPFLRQVTVPLVHDDAAAYSKVTVKAAPGSRVAIEQFDTSRDRTIFGFGDGWQEPEYDPVRGLMWRWLSERGELRFTRSDRAVALHVEGETPLKYFSRPSRVVIRSGGAVLLDESISSDFSFDVTIPASSLNQPEPVVTLETDQMYVPAERSRRSADRRHLGLRIFRCALRRPPNRAS
jgi:hypothetical protein